MPAIYLSPEFPDPDGGSVSRHKPPIREKKVSYTKVFSPDRPSLSALQNALMMEDDEFYKCLSPKVRPPRAQREKECIPEGKREKEENELSTLFAPRNSRNSQLSRDDSSPLRGTKERRIGEGSCKKVVFFPELRRSF